MCITKKNRNDDVGWIKKIIHHFVNDKIGLLNTIISTYVSPIMESNKGEYLLLEDH